MAVVTSMRMEMLTKSADKPSKPPPSLLPSAPLSGEAKLATERALNSQGSRSGSPNSRAAYSSGSTSRLEELGGPVQEDEEDAVGDGPELSAMSRAGSIPLVKIELQTCPSFGEQSCKPLWFDRHGTLQRVYSAVRAKSEEEDDEDDCLQRVDEGEDSEEPVPGEPQLYRRYLPGWEIAKSPVWLMAEAALQNLQLQAHINTTHSSAVAHSPSLASVMEKPPSYDVTTTTTSTTSPTPAAIASSDSASAASTPFSSALVESHAAAASPAASPTCPTCPLLPPPLPARHTAPPPSSSPKSTAPSPSPTFARWRAALRRAQSMGRAGLLPTPLGLGAALAPSSSSTFEAARAAAARASAAGGAAGSSAATDGAAELHSHSGRHHIAFAAGLAAATSAAAAVSSAAAVATASLGSVASVGSAASLALELGSKALSAGGGVLVDRVQGVAARHAAAAVAELILGPHSSAAAREVLVSRVQATVAGASIAWFLLNLVSMSDTLAHLDFEHDFATSAKVVLDLVTSGPSLMENCKDLMHIGVALSLRVAQRNGGGVPGMGGGAFEG